MCSRRSIEVKFDWAHLLKILNHLAIEKVAQGNSGLVG